MGDIRIYQTLTGNILLNSYITPAYGLETMATTQQQQEKLQVCENNWVRRIAGVTRIDKRRMGELRERDPHGEVGGSEILTRKLVGVRSSRGSW